MRKNYSYAHLLSVMSPCLEHAQFFCSLKAQLCDKECVLKLRRSQILSSLFLVKSPWLSGLLRNIENCYPTKSSSQHSMICYLSPGFFRLVSTITSASYIKIDCLLCYLFNNSLVSGKFHVKCFLQNFLYYVCRYLESKRKPMLIIDPQD